MRCFLVDTERIEDDCKLRVSIVDRKKTKIGTHTLVAATATAADPHEAVQESEALVTGFHGKVDAVLVAGRVDTVGKSLVVDLFEDILGTRKPALSLDHDKGGRVFSGLKHVVGAELGGLVLGDDLGILTAGLYWILEMYDRV